MGPDFSVAADPATEGWAVKVPRGYRVGRWTVTEPIATGGWGSVYAARHGEVGGQDGDADLPREVALKFLPTGTLTPRQVGQLADMATRETRNHRLLAHARLIRAYETLIVDDPARPVLDGAVVIVMERAAGSLRDLVLRADDGPVPDAPRLVEQICAGLAYLHRAGWVHGDLKPANVLMMADGAVKLSDLGLADELHGTHAYAPPVASPDFAPPERWEERLGERGFAIRPTADIWALGVTAHLLLSGAHPFDGATGHTRALAAARYCAGATPLTLSSRLPAGWDDVVRDCLAPTHDHRRAHTADSLLARMRDLNGTGPRDPAPPRPRWWRRLGRRRRLAVLAATLLTGTTATLVTCAVDTDDARPARLAGRAPSLAAAPPAATSSAAFPSAAFPSATSSAAASSAQPYQRDLLRTDAGIPDAYRQLIVDAGSACREPGLSPALVAAMLRVESNFDPNLSDPAHDEYGIARWTPSVLRNYLPAGNRGTDPRPPFPPEISIPAVGCFLCFLGPRLAGVHGDPGLLLAAAYRTSATAVVRTGGPPPTTLEYVSRVREFRVRYDPQGHTVTD